MWVSPLGGTRVTRKVAMLPIHNSGLVSLACKDQDQEQGEQDQETYCCKDQDQEQGEQDQET